MINNICRPGQDKELKIHDGIIGVTVVISAVAGMLISTAWLWITVVIGVVMFSSAFTGFCPLHFLLSKILPSPKKDRITE